MSAGTAIEWCDGTWNPILGCDPVSRGCLRCYAVGSCAMVARCFKGKLPHGRVVTRGPRGDLRWNGEVIRNADHIFYAMRATTPRRDRPRRVFVNALSDVFHERAISQGLTDAIYYEMRAYNWNHYIALTKRPEAAARWYAEHPEAHNLRNVHVGVSVEDARVLHRIDILRSLPVVVRVISFEPLVGPVGRIDLSGIGWAIVGGESDWDEAVPLEAAWAREVRDQCRAAGVPFFFKQWAGSRPTRAGTRTL